MADGAPWSRLQTVTIPQYIRDVEPNILRNRKILALMQSKGRVALNYSGTKMNWKIQYRRAPLATFTDGETITFSKQDRWKECELGYRAYIATDSMSEMEALQNKGEPAIVNYYSDVLKNLTDDITENFGDQVYIDGNATGNDEKIHGIESFMGANLAAVAGNGFAAPSDSYAGLSTAPGAYGGNWSGTLNTAAGWPNGKGDPHYDFFSPILVNYTDATSGVWTATTKTWPYTCIEALRKGITKTRKQKSRDGQLDMISLEESLYDEFKGSYESKQEIEVQRGEANGLLSLGFQDVINFDGVDITTEYGLPLYTGYGFNTMHMELASLQGQLFTPDGPHWSEETASWRFAIKYYGNMRFNPRNMMKLYPYGANA